MAISKIILNGVTQMDLTSDTVEASNLLQNYTAHKNDGTQVTGTATAGGNDFIITISWDDNQQMYVPDCTFAEIQSAYNSGKNINIICAGSIETTVNGSYDDSDVCLYYTVNHYDYNINRMVTQWYIYDSNGLHDDGSANFIAAPTGTLNITANDTYDVTNYASAVVNVPSSGGSSWTKVAETSYQVSTTSTSAATIDTWATGHSEIWTSEKIVYVRIRDTVGSREGYFYGTDQFFLNPYPVNGTSETSANNVGRFLLRYASSAFNAIGSTTGYGVYADTIYSDGRIRIRRRYGSNYGTINGTYKVEVYLLDPPTGAPIFT